MRSLSMTSLGKRILGGASIAAGGAFIWAVFSFTCWFFQGHNPGETLVHVVAYAAWAILMTSWFVVPLGATLGLVLPRIVSRCSRQAAFVRGAVLGIVAAVIAAVLTSLLMEWS